MKLLDRLLQRWRERLARPWVPSGGRVLDVGCHQGEFLERLGKNVRDSVGLDPLTTPRTTPEFTLLAELFREPLPYPDGSFDAIVMLATLEHIQDKEPLARECRRLLRDGGRAIITVPSPRVDAIVHTLVRLRLADGMSLDEHHGFDPTQTKELFTRHGFEVEYQRRFQLGLNYLFVFSRTAAPAVSG